MRSPLVAVAFVYILGIIIASYFHIPTIFLFTLLVVLLSSAAVFFRKGSKQTSLFLLLVSLLLGCLWQSFSVSPNEDDISNFAQKEPVTLVGTVIEEPKITESRKRFVLRAEGIKASEDYQRVSGLALVYLNPEIKVQFGDRIGVEGRLCQPRGASNPGQFSFRDYLARRKIYAILYGNTKAQVETFGQGEVNFLLRWAVAARHKIFSRLKETMPQPDYYAPLLASLVFGMQASPLPKWLEEDFRKAGAIHVLVASGSQVTFLIILLSALYTFRSRRPSLWFLFSVIVPAVVVYVLLAGPYPAILRAAIMGLMVLLASQLGWIEDIYNLLALAALIILIMNPLAVYSVSMQLTFAATWGLLYIGGKIREFWSPGSKGAKWAWIIITMSIGAQLAVAPITAYYFNKIYLTGFLSNLFVVPLAGLVLETGFVGCLLGLLWTPLALLINKFNWLVVFIIANITHFFAQAPSASLLVARPSLLSVFGYFAVLILIAQILKVKKEASQKSFPVLENLRKIGRERLIATGLILVVSLLWLGIFRVSNKDLLVTFLDVGQGDAIFIQAPSGRNVLIDGGKEFAGSTVVESYLRHKGIKRIDLVVLTHPDEDHIGGLPLIMRDFQIGAVLDNPYEEDSQAHRECLKVIKSKRIPLKTADFGQEIKLGEGIEALVLNPDEWNLFRETRDDSNNNSIVLRLSYGEIEFLFAGDAEFEAENKILNSKVDLESEIIKIAHHGSRYSTSQEILQRVHPKVAVISVGEDNAFGHPSEEVIQRLNKFGTEIYRTDKYGAITVKTNGKRFWVKSFLKTKHL